MTLRLLRKIIPYLAVFTYMCGSSPVKQDPQSFVETPVSAPDQAVYFGWQPSSAVNAPEPKSRSVDSSKFLVNPDNYTTDGGVYQKKYQSNLLNIIERVKHSMNIGEESVGFYYDKKANNRKLYVGIDIIMEDIAGADYGMRARTVIYNNLVPLMENVNTQKVIFKEERIAGMVVSFKWKGSEQINVWVSAADVERFLNRGMTLDELIQRSELIDGQGKRLILK
ncbi:MAG: hypothetical protein FWG13_01025 [Leptospirales bacterium]|nr:hypothetical protein [Leptospirales bacterium]